jgi:eukaryotic-like serine/threonine-protein kinase
MSDDLEMASPQLGPTNGTSAAVHLDATTRPAPMPRRRASKPTHERLPERLGRYLVLDRIGQGGMGVVVSAYDPELDRKLAIKLLRSDHATDEARARLVREAQAMAKLSHPNVVPVFDVGVVDEQVFVAMELVRGQTLAAWLRDGPHPWPAVLERFVAAGQGLAAAHEAGSARSTRTCSWRW